MRFCSACAAPLDHAPPVRCPACGREHWRNAKPCAGALVVRAGAVLLVQRNIEPWRDHWDIPGGFCEPEEHPITTAIREVREETGLAIEVTGYLGMWIDAYGDAATGEAATLTLNCYYHARPLGGEPVANLDEVSELDWFAPDDLPARIAFADHARAVLAAWRHALTTGATFTSLPDRPV
jgi:8-oxo-dGTP diphosphatase